MLECEFVWFLSIRWVVHSRSSEILGFLFPIVEKHTSVIAICGYGFTNSWINNVRWPPSPPPGEFSSRSPLSRTLFPHRPPKSNCYTSVPCQSPGPTIPTPHGSQAGGTLGRRHILLDISLALYSTVRQFTRSSTRARFICLILRSRNRHRSFLSMFDRTAQPDKSHKGRYQVGTRGSQRSLVFECDSISCNRPLHSVLILHRRPRVSWCRWSASWTFRLWVAPPVHRTQCHFSISDPGEPVASRRSFSEFCTKLSSPGVQRSTSVASTAVP